MNGKKDPPNRRSIRRKDWDYTRGHYFVTVNTRGGRAVFGTVAGGKMVTSETGRLAEACWREIPVHFPQAGLDEFIVMPNHVHGIIRLHHAPDAPWPPARPRFGQPIPGALGTVIGAYKAAVSRIAHRTGLACQTLPLPAGASALWHRNYWDISICDERALAAIRAYIRQNPRNYQTVLQCGEPRHLGDAALLALPKLGFLASRGEPAGQHGELPVRPGEAILSGFLSPMERRVFRAGLARRRPLIWVKPWALEEGADAPEVRDAVRAGRLLILSPFPEDAGVPSARRAVWCNHYVIEHAERLAVGHLNPDGMLACLLSEADPDKEIEYL